MPGFLPLLDASLSTLVLLFLGRAPETPALFGRAVPMPYAAGPLLVHVRVRVCSC